MTWINPKNRLFCAAMLFGCLTLALTGCFSYSFRGALPSAIKTIAIPLFGDRSNWVGIQEQMTESVINAFIDDNALQVIDDEEESDLVMRGVVNSVSTRLSAVSSDEVVQEQQLVVSVKIDCYNRQTEKPLWSGTVSDYGTMSGSGTLEEQDQAIAQALEKIVAEVINRTVAAW